MTNTTITMSQSRYWVGTQNNVDVPPLFDANKMQYLVYQLERGENTNHLHYQFYVQLKRNQRLSYVKTCFPGAHLEIQMGSNDEARDYCMKEDTRVDGPWEFGEFKPSATRGQSGKRTDLHDVIDMVREKRPREEYLFNPAYVKYYRGIEHIRLLSEQDYNHKECRGIWIYGPPGVGKSHYVRENYPDLFMKAQNKWWDGYNGQKSILIDDFDRQGACLSHHLKLWADKWACTGEFKGGRTKLQHHHLIITSNYTIEDIFADTDAELKTAIKRRFTIIKVPERGRFEQETNLEKNLILYNSIPFNNRSFLVDDNENKENI